MLCNLNDTTCSYSKRLLTPNDAQGPSTAEQASEIPNAWLFASHRQFPRSPAVTSMMNRPRGSFEAIKSEISQSVLTIQKPSDFIVTLIYCIPILAPVRICIEAGLFEELSTCEHPKSADDLAEFLGQADGQAIQGHNERRDFVVRMLRVVAAIGGVDEHAEFMYSANEVTKAMADPGFAAGFQMIFDNVMGPQSTMSEMVRYHKENGWRAASSATDGPWQRARDRVGRSTFDSWISDDPIQLTRLSSFMQRMQRDRPHWTEWFPEDALFRKGGIDIVFVDMGGGRGHDLLALAKKYPDKTMSLVLQDLPAVIAGGEETRSQSGQALDKRIEVVKHSFFEPQPVQGANVYYMHKIMHDWLVQPVRFVYRSKY